MEDPLAWQGIATKCLHSLYGGGTCWLLMFRFVSDIVALCLNQNVTHLSSFDTWNLANQGEEAKQAELGPMRLCGAMFFLQERLGIPCRPLIKGTYGNLKEQEYSKYSMKYFTPFISFWNIVFFPKSISLGLARQFCAVAISYGFADPW